MRGVLALVLVAACGFDHGNTVTPDAPRPDMPVDEPSTTTWEMDSISGKAVPAAAFEWTALLQANGLAKSPPDHLWLMQDTVGVLEDQIGAINLAPNNYPSYRNMVPGWSRVAVGTSEMPFDQSFISTTIGDLDGRSYLLLAYLAVLGTPSGERGVLGIGATTDHRYVAITPAPVFKGTGNGGVTPTMGTINPTGAVHPVILKITPGSMSYVIYTDQEKLTVAWSPTTAKGPLLVFGNAINSGASARYLYSALWVGTSAEFADFDVKRLLTALGWTVTWN